MPRSGRSPRWRNSSTTRAAFTSFPAKLSSTARPAISGAPSPWRNLGKLRHLGKVATTRTLAAEVERRISDPHLRQIFLRFATYNGSSPYLTPATFNIIPYVEAEFGAWYVRGGMAKIAEALAALAQRQGSRFASIPRSTDRDVAHDGREATAHDGNATSSADLLVCNGDALSCPDRFSLRALHRQPEIARQAADSLPLQLGLYPVSRRAWMRSPPRPSQRFLLGRLPRRIRRNPRARKSARPSRPSTCRSVRAPIPPTLPTATIIISSWSTRPRAIPTAVDPGRDAGLSRPRAPAPRKLRPG